MTALDGPGWENLQTLAKNTGTELKDISGNNLLLNILLTLAPYILLFAVVWFLFMRQIRSAGGGIGMLGNFGRSRHRLLSKEHTNITFNDVAGIDESKEELTEIVEFLKTPKRFQRLGGRIPRGVLLIGDPGVGQNPTGQSHCRRSQGALLYHQRFGFCGNVCRRGRQPRARLVQDRQGIFPLHYLFG